MSIVSDEKVLRIVHVHPSLPTSSLLSEGLQASSLHKEQCRMTAH